MDPLTVVALILGLAQALVLAFGKYGSELWDKPLRDIIPEELRISVEKRLADAAAAEKFGEATPPENPFGDP
jgi:hypothetical protein